MVDKLKGLIKTEHDSTGIFIQVGRGSFAGKSFGSVITVGSRFFQCFKYIYVACILVCLYLVFCVCFYDLLNRGVFRTFSNIQDGAFCESS